jgi:hypothetical protein
MGRGEPNMHVNSPIHCIGAQVCNHSLEAMLDVIVNSPAWVASLLAVLLPFRVSHFPSLWFDGVHSTSLPTSLHSSMLNTAGLVLYSLCVVCFQTLMDR